jgi:protein SCO1/2
MNLNTTIMLTNLPIRFFLFLIASLAISGLSVVAPACSAQDESDSSENSASATGDTNDPYGLNNKPEALKNIGVDSQIGEFLQMDVYFDDEQNRHIKIGDYFDGKQPIMLSFNYSDCPKLCSVQLENMTLALREVASKANLWVGDVFLFVSISIDQNEQTSRARL